ncbi:DUF4430 domain-containing protein [Lactobacillus bombicola]|jgi:hypothetical protein|uniref:DUF4430 domain-containing protein n=2 Tax=Lactobacillus bombicola TaxID=1505723 RepID=A0A396SQC1_9LACO|nr:DUF4430 domain-containing protein [Lactobacillus bombicola]RHW54142.1 DUF4430 domain-containing protein [Lactobacillus bombicola]
MKRNKLAVLAGIATIFTFSLTGNQTSQEVMAKPSNKITVAYTLNVNKKNIKNKKVKLSKHATVMAGLKKAWRVKSTNGFITAIDGKSQDTHKQIYWTYTINGKFANKGAAEQKVNNHDKVKFTLAKMN